MSTFLIVLALALLAGLLVRLVATVRSDGYGVRPAPRSHRADGAFGVAAGREHHHPHV